MKENIFIKQCVRRVSKPIDTIICIYFSFFSMINNIIGHFALLVSVDILFCTSFISSLPFSYFLCVLSLFSFLLLFLNKHNVHSKLWMLISKNFEYKKLLDASSTRSRIGWKVRMLDWLKAETPNWLWARKGPQLQIC